MTTIVSKIGYIYKIVCNDSTITDSYVGSCSNITKRRYNHKSKCNNPTDKYYNLNVYQFIRANGGWSNWNMIAIEQVSYTVKYQLLIRERFHLENLGATLNRLVPARTRQEYRDEHKEQISQKNKENYQLNKTELLEKNKEYKELNKQQINEKRKELITCECHRTFRKSDISAHKNSKIHKQYEQIYNFIYS
jgi:hypothetical protein